MMRDLSLVIEQDRKLTRPDDFKPCGFSAMVWVGVINQQEIVMLHGQGNSRILTLLKPIHRPGQILYYNVANLHPVNKQDGRLSGNPQNIKLS